jgi:hypothetical protein
LIPGLKGSSGRFADRTAALKAAPRNVRREVVMREIISRLKAEAVRTFLRP